MNRSLLTISIVSHGHGTMLMDLLDDLEALCASYKEQGMEILLTLNIPESEDFLTRFKDLPIKVHRNPVPKGFGANHNSAFKRSCGQYFVVVNPDIRLRDFDLDLLLPLLRQDKIAAVAPRVEAGDGTLQDNARRFPSVARLVYRRLTRRFVPDYPSVGSAVPVDWVAGMFVVFNREAWDAVGGFDERYFMYFEDVDICRRLQKAGWKVIYQSATTVIHDAQRASHHDPAHLRWHLRSALRYFTGV